MSKIARRIRALQLAEQCVAFGARPSVVMAVTGLARYDLRSLLPEQPSLTVQGRLPETAGWNKVNLFHQVEASMFASVFSSMLRNSDTPAEALVTGYRLFRSSFAGDSRVTFDRAYCVARQLHALWGETQISLELVRCPRCRLQNLTVIGDAGLASATGCAFCALVSRYGKERPLRARYTAHMACFRPLPQAWVDLMRLITDVSIAA